MVSAQSQYQHASNPSPAYVSLYSNWLTKGFRFARVNLLYGEMNGIDETVVGVVES